MDPKATTELPPGTDPMPASQAGPAASPSSPPDASPGSPPGREAALLAARRGQEQVTMPDFTDSLEKIVLGTVRGIVLEPRERERTAYQYGYSASYLRGRITGALGGRAAEEVIYGDVTTGAESDMEHASGIARQMVGRWGMSPAVGPVSVLPAQRQESPYGLDNVAPATRELVDTEARRIIEECYEQAVATLRGHRDQLDRLAHALLSRETLEEGEAYAAAGIDHRADLAPVPADLSQAG